jgi:hypothetical protein
MGATAHPLENETPIRTTEISYRNTLAKPKFELKGTKKGKGRNRPRNDPFYRFRYDIGSTA